MKIIDASYEILTKVNGEQILKDIEKIGRTCYKSENKITEDSAKKFVGMLVKNGHEAMIEHSSITVKFICDRGVSHELVRHRLASFAQESTRYCNYSKDKFENQLTFINPCFESTGPLIKTDIERYNIWYYHMKACKEAYLGLINSGMSPQMARTVLPNSLKTEIVMTMNLREWRHFFKLRCDKAAHPQMRELTIPLLVEFKKLIPVVFDDIYDKYFDFDPSEVD